MLAARFPTDPGAAEASSELTSQRRARDYDGETSTQAQKDNHGAAPSDSSNVDSEAPSLVRMGNTGREEESCTNLFRFALSVYSHVDIFY